MPPDHCMCYLIRQLDCSAEIMARFLDKNDHTSVACLIYIFLMFNYSAVVILLFCLPSQYQ